MASLLTPEFVAAAGLPADPAGQQAARRRLAPAEDGDLHRPGRIRRRPAPAGHRPDRRRGARRGLAARRRLDLGGSLGAGDPGTGGRGGAGPGGHGVRRRHRRRTRSRPRTSTCSPLRSLGVPRRRRSSWWRTPGTGCVAATGAGLTCVITVNDFTADEDFSEAALVVSSLGDPAGERTDVLANRSSATPGDWITLADLASVLPTIRDRRRRGDAPEPRSVHVHSKPRRRRGRRPHDRARSRSTTRSTSATWTRWSATATSATRWPAASSWCCRTGTTSTAPTSARS